MSKDKIKGFLSGIVIMACVFSLSITVYAVSGTKNITASYNNIKIYIDQKLITPKDANGSIVDPFIYNGTVYLPVRAVSNALGQEVSWDSENKAVYIGKQAEEAPPIDEYTLTSGNYIAGTDFPAGTYNVEAVAGAGNVSSDNMYTGGIHAIMGTAEADEAIGGNFYEQIYRNISLPKGTTLTVTSVTIKLTPSR